MTKKPTEIKDFPGRAVQAHLTATGALPSETRIAELEAENAALKRDIACRPGTLDLSYRVREALGFNKYYPLSHLDDDVRKLKRVEQEARRLISEGLQNTPDGLIVRENADRSDPHWALCHALDLIEPMNKPV